MSKFGGVILISDAIRSEPDSVLSTDACITGKGDWVDSVYFQCESSSKIQNLNLHINFLELLVVVVALKLWSHKVCIPTCHNIYCDQMASFLTLNSNRTHDGFMLKMLAKNHLYLRRCQLSVEGYTSFWSVPCQGFYLRRVRARKISPNLQYPGADSKNLLRNHVNQSSPHAPMREKSDILCH